MASATAPSPTANEPMNGQLYASNLSKIHPPASEPKAMPMLDSIVAAPNTVPIICWPKYSRATTA
jgi:hypothetical protein